jgi:glutamate synthase domain-containing protein 2/glutamate synthase domain-containing protein 1/glutamate synthase domain-containing protein 3
LARKEDPLEKDGCGVGFIVSLRNERSHDILNQGLHALERMEHRGGTGPDNIGDGAGIMTGIPYELFGREPGTFAVAFLYAPREDAKKDLSLKVFEETFWQFGLKVSGYRDVPVDTTALSAPALKVMPFITQAIIERPSHCRTLYSFERLLYHARMATRTKEKENGIYQQFYFSSLSPRTIVYKALGRSPDLRKFYLDLQDEKFRTNFALIHRRFSTNTISTWDKVQPFRLIAHNGEINTIEGNKSWAITREKDLGLKADELITHKGMSDSGNLNMIAEGLRYRSSIPKLTEVMAILIPPVNHESNYYKFWSRGMEPWDGPAMVAFSDGKYIGARLDRNGFRPCRWQKTEDHFFLASEAGVFDVADEMVTEKGALSSGESITVNLLSGELSFLDPQDFPENKHANFDAQTIPLEYRNPPPVSPDLSQRQKLFGYSREDVEKILIPMARDKKEPLGSMGDTATLPFLSKEPRSIFDYFYQDFAQVTNPPIDYIREKIVTDMRVFLGRKPNIFEPKEFIPLKACLELDGPVISLGQMEYLKSLSENPLSYDLRSFTINLTFKRGSSVAEFIVRLEEMKALAVMALKKGYSLLIFSDRAADSENLPIPSLLAMSYINIGLNETGQRLRASLIMEVGDVRNPHQLACLLSYGASVVCPYLALEAVIESPDQNLAALFPEDREKNLLKAMKDGVLRVMSKRGISVFRSYQGSKLFTPLGIGSEVNSTFFRKKSSVIGGLNLEGLVKLLHETPMKNSEELAASHIFKEHAAQKSGENHTLTTKRSRMIHKLVSLEDEDEAFNLFREFSKEVTEVPAVIRHLFTFKKLNSTEAKEAEPVERILTRFGSGAMSFGAISAEAQRDLILAFKEIGGRSNSGEGGENPYYKTDGIAASIKQIASGRFGVTAEYLVHSEEVQIKIAQGAKPGEGGQLMGVKVTEEIAKARFTSPGVDLISPAPQHDIYSIEDLKELIFEIRSLAPHVKVSVKLVSGDNVGAIAVGVAKAGADIIQISGGDGGTGAASLLSMKHAGLPLEVGLLEVHRALHENGLRKKIILRADGGLFTGKDLIVAALLGADQFDFGKLVLVGEGCIMARVCEKNTCPAGIATHNPKFKALYKGEPAKVVRLLKAVAREVHEELKEMGAGTLDEIIGKNHLLVPHDHHLTLIKERGLDLSHFMKESESVTQFEEYHSEKISVLNLEIVNTLNDARELRITNSDRAIPATLSGLYAGKHPGLPEKVNLNFRGSAGQGFGVFNVSEITIRLQGEANDSVGKGMSGGLIAIRAPGSGKEKESLIGNCALYGATGGMLLASGIAGDRFAVRNSGAIAIVEGVGLHACEYMSGGTVWILGRTKRNLGAGMTGGVAFIRKDAIPHVNSDSVATVPVSAEDEKMLLTLAQEYVKETESATMKKILEESLIRADYVKLVPLKKS